MNPINIQKIAVTAKSRTLKATWTVEQIDNAIHEFGDDLEKILQEEIDREIMFQIAEGAGWFKVTATQSADPGWCLENLTGRYHTKGREWIFESHTDATMFSLVWA